jgi:hypothetical protein
MTSRTPRSTRNKPTPPAPQPIPEAVEDSPRSPLFLDPEPMGAADLQAREDRILAQTAETDRQLSDSPQNGPVAADSGSPFGTLSTETPNAKPAKPKLTRAALRGYARKAVELAGGVVAQMMTKPDTYERQIGLWVPDESDVQAVADPVAGLVSRRIPDKVAGALNPDVEDGFALAIALVQYVGKQLAKKAALRASLADQGPADMTAGDVEAVPA